MAKKNAVDLMMTRVVEDLFPKKESRLEAALANILEKREVTPSDDEKLEYERKRIEMYQDLFPKLSEKEIIKLVRSDK